MSNTAVAIAATRPYGRRPSGFIHACDEAIRFGERSLWPVLDLLVRLWVAQAFWVSGVVKVTNWDNALFLAAHEYPVAWMDPVTAAYVGVAIELICPVLLTFGLATRLAAAPLLILSLVIQFSYIALSVHLFWAILMGWYVVMGPGPLSLDRLLGRGLAAAALPFTGGLTDLYAWLTRTVGPAYQLFMRLWIARIFFAVGLVGLTGGEDSALLFPFEASLPGLLAHAPEPLGAIVAVAGAILLAVGLAARVAALPLLALSVGVGAMTMQSVDPVYWFALLGIIALKGPGRLSLDHVVVGRLRHAFPRVEDAPRDVMAQWPHVVVVGAGFGGLAAVRALSDVPCRITLIDRRNYHLFQPLLYQVATATLSPADIATPVRAMLRDQGNVRVLLGRVTDVDVDRREVAMGQSRVPYDHLVLATGARHSYFGKDDWEPYAPGLKKIDDATDMRRRILLAFERAENDRDPETQKAYLTFVVVGGGPTGVELAGAIAELAKHGMEREFRNIDPAQARVLLIQSAPRLLPTFPETLSTVTEESLHHLGVEVRTGSRVEAVDADGVTVGNERIATRTVFWAAGVAASQAAKWVEGEHDRAGRVKVGPDLSLPGHAEIFAIGDTALSDAWNGQPVPGLAPAAKQGGAYVARVLRARVLGRRPPRPFRYHHLGSMATIGRSAAVADFGRLRLSGPLAWWLWGLVHIFFLVGARNRVAVAIEWFWAYLTFRRSTRLITGD